MGICLRCGYELFCSSWNRLCIKTIDAGISPTIGFIPSQSGSGIMADGAWFGNQFVNAKFEHPKPAKKSDQSDHRHEDNPVFLANGANWNNWFFHGRGSNKKWIKMDKNFTAILTKSVCPIFVRPWSLLAADPTIYKSHNFKLHVESPCLRTL